MVCLFCDDTVHESNNCEKYKTDEEKRKRPNANRFCFTCRADSAVAHLPEDKKCKINESCIGWFSNEHHKFFCPERIKALSLTKYFVPKINQNLLKRFSEMMELDETYLMATSSATASKLIPLKPVKIWKEYDDEREITDLNFFNGFMDFVGTNMDENKKLLDSIYSKNLIFLPRDIFVLESTLTSEIILQMLSPYMKILQLYNSSITPNIAFSEIIKNAPNLEVMSLEVDPLDGSIVYGKTWLKDLLEYKNGKNFRELYVTLDTVELDVESLVEFVKTKCTKNAKIDVRFDRVFATEEVGADEAFNVIKQKLAAYFEYYTDEDSKLTVGFFADDYDPVEFSLKKIKTPKKRIMPSRAATKRKYCF
uniref:Uncharacterized protein n=1 Tax=Panagrolaimus sp. ES5 TaxID=591445 RepID=A0AC34FX92_9BILA